MKTYSKIGWSHPSTANWSYGIWLIIDETGAKIYKETFGGDYRMKETLQKEGVEIKEAHGGYPLGKWGVRDAQKMDDIESYTGENYPTTRKEAA